MEHSTPTDMSDLPMATSSVAPQPRRRKLFIIVFVAAIVVLGAAASVLAYTGAWTPFRKVDSVAVLAQAQERLIDATSVRLAMDAAITIEEKTGDDQASLPSGTLFIRGAVVDAESEKGDSVSEATIVISGEASIGSFSVTMDNRAISDRLFLRFRDLTVKPADSSAVASTGAIVGAVEGAIGGKWMRVDPAAVAQFLGDKGGEAIKSIIPASSESAAIQERLKTQLRTQPLLVFRENLGTDRVDGVQAYHFNVVLDTEAVRGLLKKVLSNESDPLTPELIEAIEAARGEVWIAKRTGDFVRMEHSFDVAASEKSGQQTPRVHGQIAFNFSDWGKLIVVEEPADAVPVEQILSSFLGGLTGQSQDEGKTSTVSPALDSDSDGLSDADELRYGTDPQNPDSDGDGYRDGDEVRDGYNPKGSGRL
ncbi:MAG: hypothetical protein V1723_05010 [Candidatus Uhrbacteria bacterium]